jgi:hypothetical protein
MSKKKSKQKLTTIDTHRFILHEGKSMKLSNKTGVEILVTTFPAVHHE